jgi:hypothetical protein
MEPHEEHPGEAAEVIAELDALSQRAPEILPRLQARKRWLLAELEKVARYERMLNECCEEATLRAASPTDEPLPAAPGGRSASRRARKAQTAPAPDPMAELRTASLPEASLKILRAAGRSLMTSEVHQTIRAYRPTVTIATLRTTLLRLAHKRQVLTGKTAEGRTTFALLAAAPPAAVGALLARK